MKFKAAARALAPPVVARAWRRYRRPVAVWSGVYPHWRDVPVEGPGFDGQEWVAQTQRHLEEVRSAERSLGWVPNDIVETSILGPLAATFSGTVRILDFGGGLGTTYVALAAALGRATKLDYTIVESAAICRAGRERFADDRAISFSETLPETHESFDIVHVRTALQYVEEPMELLRRLVKHEPRVVALVQLSAGLQPTFASAQLNLHGSRIPYWFLNRADIVRSMQSMGYELRYGALRPTEDRQENLPPTHRMGRPCDLVFMRNGP